VTRTPGTHGYVCECARLACRERLYLAPCDYASLRRAGTVVHRACARRERRTILRPFGEAVVVRTAWSRIGSPA
jgi:hypothetical protein